VRCGEIYTAAARGPYTGKPRPVLIVQDDRFDATASVYDTNSWTPAALDFAILTDTGLRAERFSNRA
jgi:mRNA-degrading endonuclease toxin of MazEF toxin-antitoxin module